MTVASLCYEALRISGVTSLARRVGAGGVILCYHNVVAARDAGAAAGLGVHMPLPTFERQMRWLVRNYDVVSLSELVGRVTSGASLRGKAAVTFDDAYAGVFDLAWPLLRALAIPATVFVVADAASGSVRSFWWDDPQVLHSYAPEQRGHFLVTMRGDGDAIVESFAPPSRDRALAPWTLPAGWPAISEAVRSGLQLGVHSSTHRSLPELDDEDLRPEVIASRDVITRCTGVRPEFFAYPYGLWNERVREAVRSAGYAAAFTLEHSGRARASDRWALPRLNVPAGIGDAAFQAWTAGLNPTRVACL